jgi:hypothetical protein
VDAHNQTTDSTGSASTEPSRARAEAGVPAPTSSVKLSTRVKGPPSIEVTVHHENPYTSESCAIEIFERLRQRYGSYPDAEES